jgi:hypothetical protein
MAQAPGPRRLPRPFPGGPHPCCGMSPAAAGSAVPEWVDMKDDASDNSPAEQSLVADIRAGTVLDIALRLLAPLLLGLALLAARGRTKR